MKISKTQIAFFLNASCWISVIWVEDIIIFALFDLAIVIFSAYMGRQYADFHQIWKRSLDLNSLIESNKIMSSIDNLRFMIAHPGGNIPITVISFGPMLGYCILKFGYLSIFVASILISLALIFLVQALAVRIYSHE